MTNLAEPFPESPADSDLSGRQLGGYQLLRRLGRGAMAEVYLAEQTSLRRNVALKILKRELAKDQSYVRRFQNEAQAAAALVHPNIVQIYEVGCVDGIQFIAQEYVPGQNLRELMTRRGLPEVKLALAILRQVASALAKSADQGIVHRDIKPENIMLARTGEVKVADFGLARLASGGDALNLTQVGVTMGTPLYMSPEQVEGRSLDCRSDLYSLGVTSYHMLSGEPPFRGDTPLSVAVQHLRTPPARLETVRPDLPAGLCRIVHRLLAKEPSQRYQNPQELLRDLRPLTAETAGSGANATLDEAQEWSVADLAAIGESPLDSTQQLEQVMKTQALVRDSGSWVRYLLAGIAAAFCIGAVLAFATRDRFLLADSGATDAIPQLKSAEAQYQYAMLANTEAGWQSVFQYYPQDEVWVPLAKQQLARLYLQQEDYSEATRLFTVLANMDKSELRFRAFGLAGLCVVNVVQQNEDELNENLARLNDLIDPASQQSRAELLDRQMLSLVTSIMENKKKTFEAAQQDQINLLLKTLIGPSPTKTAPAKTGPAQAGPTAKDQ